MSWQKVEGNWRQFAAKLKLQWAKLSDNDLKECEGNRELLVGKLQQLYGFTSDRAEDEIAKIEYETFAASRRTTRLYSAM